MAAIPPAVSRSLLTYAAMGLLFSVLYRIPGFQLGKDIRPGVRFLLRLRTDALLSGQPHLARPARSGTASRRSNWASL